MDIWDRDLGLGRKIWGGCRLWRMFGWRRCWAGEDVGLVKLTGWVGCLVGDDVRLERMSGCGRYMPWEDVALENMSSW